MLNFQYSIEDELVNEHLQMRPQPFFLLLSEKDGTVVLFQTSVLPLRHLNIAKYMLASCCLNLVALNLDLVS